MHFSKSQYFYVVAKINVGLSTVYCYTSLSVCLVAINALYTCTFSGIAESLVYRDEVAVLKVDAMGYTLGFGILALVSLLVQFCFHGYI